MTRCQTVLLLDFQDRKWGGGGGAGQTGRPEVQGCWRSGGSVDPGPAHWKEKAGPETEGHGLV